MKDKTGGIRERTVLEVMPKFAMGDTVYVGGPRTKPGIVRGIDGREDSDGEIYYLYRLDFSDDYFTEEVLVSEKLAIVENMIEKLTLKTGDILVMRGEFAGGTTEALRKELKRFGVNVGVLTVPCETSISVITPDGASPEKDDEGDRFDTVDALLAENVGELFDAKEEKEEWEGDDEAKKAFRFLGFSVDHMEKIVKEIRKLI